MARAAGRVSGACGGAKLISCPLICTVPSVPPTEFKFSLFFSALVLIIVHYRYRWIIIHFIVVKIKILLSWRKTLDRTILDGLTVFKVYIHVKAFWSKISRVTCLKILLRFFKVHLVKPVQ